MYTIFYSFDFKKIFEIILSDFPKVQNIKAYVEGMNPKPVLGHCMHSYSQLWLWPYGYAYNAYPENYQEIVSYDLIIQFD